MHDTQPMQRPGASADGHRISRRDVLKAAMAFGGAAALPLSLSGCSTGPAGLEFWQWYAPQSGGGYSVSAQNSWFAKLVRDWHARGGAPLELTYIPVSQYTEGTQLQAAFSADQGPDLFIISPGDFLRYYNGGVLYDLTDLLGTAVEDFYDSALASRAVDGRVYGLPMENEPLAMFYSVQAFEEAGLAEGDIPTTWDDLLDVAETLTTGQRYGVMFETAPTVYQTFCWYPFLWQAGGDVVTRTHSEFDSDAAVRALGFWKDAFASGVAPRTPQGGGGGDLVANLGSGYTAMQQMTTAGGAFLAEGAPDLEFGTFPLPVPEQGTDPVTAMGGWAVCVNKDSPRAREAAEFAVWAVAGEASTSRMLDWSFSTKKALPTRRSVMGRAAQEGLFSEHPLMAFSAFDALGLTSETVTDPDLPLGRGEPRFPPEVVKAVSDALQAVVFTDADPAEAAQDADAQITSALTGYDGAPMGS